MDPYQVLTETLVFNNQDEERWWQSTAPILAKMMKDARYDVHLQYKYLCLHRTCVIPSLGPYPRTNELRWKCTLTRYGLPFELSFNYPQGLVRTVWEPIGPMTGTMNDPFNTQRIHKTVETLSRLIHGVDLKWFQHFVRELVTTDEEDLSILKKHGDVGVFKTQNMLAFDYDKKDGNARAKVYLYPQLKSLATGVSTKKLMLDSIRNADVEGNLSGQLSILEEYIASRTADTNDHEADDGPSLFPCFLSCDLVEPRASRVKVYLAENDVSFHRIEDLWTLGGRRTDLRTIAGLRYLKDLWDALPLEEGLRTPSNIIYDLGKCAPMETLSLIINFNLHPSDPLPQPQIYFFVGGHNDLVVADALTSFFERVGWKEIAESYKPNISAYHCGLDLSQSTQLQSWVSYSFKDSAPYVSVYTQLFEPIYGVKSDKTGHGI
ncbi:dimethylallyl tryptophan synthase [Aspergillus candidus]|uniref:Dimethylallyl tryptophan synthase n=1 Tax=Aspergillus candidus TaxID=41067 RepID=A0A2I2FGX4_ASPCN|nr:dimethylallyl tryptophan synthase [Aspergillus candidus]PLB39886.1 dimethylallyl tryptophan synthase [Aspergillus candidus]